jgi:hypothetical protein
LSLRRHHPNDTVIVFDNSNKYPLGLNQLVDTLLDNTQGQLIDFNEFLVKFPYRDIDRQVKSGVNFGSAKHSLSIQYLCNYIEDEFVLLDSDILLKRPIDFVDNQYACVCEPYKNIDGSKLRCSPMLCYLNVKKLRELDVSYFDSNRMLGLNTLNPTSMTYDTGSSLYEDLIKLNMIKTISMNDYIEHYGNGSWSISKRSGIRHTTLSPTEWLFVHRKCFMPLTR